MQRTNTPTSAFNSTGIGRSGAGSRFDPQPLHASATACVGSMCFGGHKETQNQQLLRISAGQGREEASVCAVQQQRGPSTQGMVPPASGGRRRSAPYVEEAINLLCLRASEQLQLHYAPDAQHRRREDKPLQVVGLQGGGGQREEGGEAGGRGGVGEGKVFTEGLAPLSYKAHVNLHTVMPYANRTVPRHNLATVPALSITAMKRPSLSSPVATAGLNRGLPCRGLWS